MKPSQHTVASYYAKYKDDAVRRNFSNRLRRLAKKEKAK